MRPLYSSMGSRQMARSDLEAKLDARIKELFINSVPRYYHHTLEVVAKMKEIIKREGKGGEVLLPAAYLHDIGYCAPHRDSFAGEIADPKEKIKVHSQAGAGIARQILQELDCEPELIDRVAYLVQVHHRQDIDDEQLKLLLEADTL